MYKAYSNDAKYCSDMDIAHMLLRMFGFRDDKAHAASLVRIAQIRKARPLHKEAWARHERRHGPARH